MVIFWYALIACYKSLNPTSHTQSPRGTQQAFHQTNLVWPSPGLNPASNGQRAPALLKNYVNLTIQGPDQATPHRQITSMYWFVLCLWGLHYVKAWAWGKRMVSKVCLAHKENKVQLLISDISST